MSEDKKAGESVMVDLDKYLERLRKEADVELTALEKPQPTDGRGVHTSGALLNILNTMCAVLRERRAKPTRCPSCVKRQAVQS